MASRYFVGSGTNWSSTASWATSSGGASGASVPTAADDVFFDAASPGNATISADASCLSINCTGFTHTLTHASGMTLTVAGSPFTLVGTMVYALGGTGALKFTQTAAGTVAIKTGGQTLGAVTTGDAAGTSTATYQLQSAVTAATWTHVAGTLDTNNFALGAGVTSSSGFTRTITLGTSTITGAWSVTPGGLTLNAASGTVSATGSSFAGGGMTYGTVVLAGTVTTVTGANTFATLTRSNATTAVVTFGADQVVTGTLTFAGTGSSRVQMGGSPFGTARTITAAVVSLTNVDFCDITAAGAAAPFSGTRIGNCAGNTNITFAAAVTRYAKVAGGGSFAAAGWSATSGGVTGASVPLPQDTAVFDANSGAGTYTTGSVSALPTIVCVAGFTRTLAFSNPAITYGSVTLCAGMTATQSGSLNLNGRGADYTYTSAGFPLNVIVNGSYALTDTISAAQLSVAAPGVFSDAGQTVTLTGSGLTVSAGATATLTGTWTIAGGLFVVGTVDASAATITYSATPFTGGGGTYGDVTLTNAACFITGANTFRRLVFPAGTQPRLPASTVTTVRNLVAIGASASQVRISSDTGSTKATLATPADVGGVYLHWCILTDIAATTATWWVDSNTTQTRCTGFTAGPPSRTKTITQDASIDVTEARPPSFNATLTAPQAAQIARASARSFAPSQAQAASMVRGIAAGARSASQTQAGALVRTTARTCSVSQTQTPGIARASTRVVGATQGQVASYSTTQTHGAGAVIVASQSQSVTFTRTAPRATTLTQAGAASVSRSPARRAAVGQSQVGSFSAVIVRSGTFRTLIALQGQLAAAARSATRSVLTSAPQQLALSRSIAAARVTLQPLAVVVQRALVGRQTSNQDQSLTITIAAQAKLLLQPQARPVVDVSAEVARAVSQRQTAKLIRVMAGGHLRSTVQPTAVLSSELQSAELVVMEV